MINRETLERAAKAAGYRILDEVSSATTGLRRGEDGVLYTLTERGWWPWNPAADRAQLMDLASDARLYVHFAGGIVWFDAVSAGVVFKPGDRASEAEAIINAAAEKGRRMTAHTGEQHE